VRELSVGDVVLGIWDEIQYPAEAVSLGVGDALILYTDGIIGARDVSDREFGVDRLSQLVATHGEESAESLATAVLAAASQFAQQDWSDDVAVMIVKRIPTYSRRVCWDRHRG